MQEYPHSVLKLVHLLGGEEELSTDEGEEVHRMDQV